MNNCGKNALNSRKGITLISLVVTIIVLLILAGISISMLSGDNGILQKATIAKENTSNLQIQEQINLAYHSALTSGLGKVEEGNLKDEIKKEFNKTDSELEEENWLDKTSVTGKWRITIDGIYLDVPAGSDDTPISVDESEKLLQYLSQENWNDVYDEENHCYKDNDFIGIKGSYLHEINNLELFYYNGGIYKTGIDVSTNTPKIEIELVKFFDNMEEYNDEIENRTILITPESPENPIHYDYEGPYNLSNNMYFLKDNNDLSLSRIYYIMHDNIKGTIVNNYYDDLGNFIVSGLHPRQVEVEGPKVFLDLYYDIDNKPFTNGYYSYDTGNYYDESGKAVQVSRPDQVSN